MANREDDFSPEFYEVVIKSRALRMQSKIVREMAQTLRDQSARAKPLQVGRLGARPEWPGGAIDYGYLACLAFLPFESAHCGATWNPIDPNLDEVVRS